MNQQQRRIALWQSIVWSFIVLLSMVVGFNFALVTVGATDWISPNAALFTVLGTFVLAATQFSLMMGGGRTKVQRDAEQNQPEN